MATAAAAANLLQTPRSHLNRRWKLLVSLTNESKAVPRLGDAANTKQPRIACRALMCHTVSVPGRCKNNGQSHPYSSSPAPFVPQLPWGVDSCCPQRAIALSLLRLQSRYNRASASQTVPSSHLTAGVGRGDKCVILWTRKQTQQNLPERGKKQQPTRNIVYRATEHRHRVRCSGRQEKW